MIFKANVINWQSIKFEGSSVYSLNMKAKTDNYAFNYGQKCIKSLQNLTDIKI